MTRARIDPAAGALVRAVRAAAGGALIVVEAETTPWASVTFSGGRHRLALRCADAETAARLADGLPAREFALAGHIVADIAEVRVDGDVLGFSALTVVEC